MKYEAYREIHESYHEMAATIHVMKQHEQEIIDYFKDRQELILLGCGSSYWACMSIARSFIAHTDKKAVALKAAEVVMAPAEYTKGYQNPILITPSRSGESKELLEAIQLFEKEYPGISVFAITEFSDNTLQKIADFHIALPFAEEISVCQTRSFNCLYTAMMTVISMLSKAQILKDFERYLEKAKDYYEQADEKVQKLVSEMEKPEIVVLGSGIQYGAVIEGAYIIMEMAQQLTNYFQTLEYRHGPVVTANSQTYAFLCATTPENLKREVQMGRELQKQQAQVILCGAAGDCEEADMNFVIDPYCEEVRGIYTTMILQHLAYHLAVKFGRNPDKPGDLVKFITY